VSLSADPRPTADADVTSPLAAATAPGDAGLSAGARPLPDYQLIRLRGRGGFGEVWEALGPGGRPVALKFVPLGGRSAASELKALELLRQVRHPNLLAVFGVWQSDGRLIIAMELADQTLADRAAAGPLPPGELLAHLRDAARALDYLNEPRHPGPDGGLVGIQHKDVKPANLLLVGGGVKVGDFGLARVLEQTVAQVSATCTPGYAAPELLGGRATRWTDQYGLAITWCHLRGGRLPFEGPPAAVLSGHLHARPDLSMLPEAERPVVARALDKQPERRWPSCVAFVEALAEAVKAAPAGPAAAAPPTLTGAPRRRGPRRRWVWATLPLLALAAVGVWRLTRPGPQPQGAGEPDAAPPTARPGPDKVVDPLPPLDRPGALALIRRHGGTIKSGNPEWLRALNFAAPGPGEEALRALALFPELEGLALHGPAVTDASLAHLQGLRGLRALHLDHTAVGDAGLACLSGLTRLQTLSLGSTAVGDAGLTHLRDLADLEELWLGHTRVTGAGMRHLAGMKRLRSLHLDVTGVGDDGLVRLAALPSLADLNLIDAPVGDEGLKHLRAFPALKVLQVRNNLITDDGLLPLADVPRLATVRVGGKNVTPEGREALKAKRPDLQVVAVD
jgi:hypothetical protein